LKSSQVKVEPEFSPDDMYGPGGESGERETAQDQAIGATLALVSGTLEELRVAAKLNSIAAILTGISVLFSAVATILGVL
jgi:hypothetical protein